MKFLRILVITTMLNISCAHAMETGSICKVIVSGVKQVVIMGGILCIADGLLEIVDGKSLLPSIDVSDSSTINGGLKAGAGAVIFLAVQPN